MTGSPPLTGKPEPTHIAIHGQVAELQRELAERQRSYPKLVREGRMKQSEADLCMARLQAALSTLQWLAANRDLIVAVKRQLGEAA